MNTMKCNLREPQYSIISEEVNNIEETPNLSVFQVRDFDFYIFIIGEYLTASSLKWICSDEAVLSRNIFLMSQEFVQTSTQYQDIPNNNLLLIQLNIIFNSIV